MEGRFEELVSRCVECDLAEPESLASLGGSAPGVVDGILSQHLTLLTMLGLWGVPSEQSRQVDVPRSTPTYYPGGRVYILCHLTTPRWGVTRFYQCLRLCSCGNTSAFQKSSLHADVIMGTPMSS